MWSRGVKESNSLLKGCRIKSNLRTSGSEGSSHVLISTTQTVWIERRFPDLKPKIYKKELQLV